MVNIKIKIKLIIKLKIKLLMIIKEITIHYKVIIFIDIKSLNLNLKKLNNF
jgi:hypothetical protein